MLDYETHAQAQPQLATYLLTSGATIDQGSKPSTDTSGVAEDVSMARKASDKEDKFMSQLNTDAYEITPEQALLCPARVRGYSFLEKTWAFFMVDKVQEIQWQPNAFDSLELDGRIKSAILAMVSAHRDHDSFDVGHNSSSRTWEMLRCIGYHYRERQRPCIFTVWETWARENINSRHVAAKFIREDPADIA